MPLESSLENVYDQINTARRTDTIVAPEQLQEAETMALATEAEGPTQASPAPPPSPRQKRPEETEPLQIDWPRATGIVVLHLLACLALIPYFFSWSGVALGVASLLVVNCLGQTVCYHRLLTHQGFKVPKWLEHIFATLGVCCLEDTPARWVAIHRMHHKHSDQQADPHSPRVSFLWGHIGWLFVKHRQHSSYLFYEQYARDILRDPFYLRFERGAWWLWTYVIHAGLYFLGGLALGWILAGYWAGVQLGASWLVWGVFVRTVVGWHHTGYVNSVTHRWGYRNYETNDDSRNNWFVALVTYGEGWHNNHHADQRSARHGHKWWEFDLTWWVIRLLEVCGLATDVVRPKGRSAPASASAASENEP